jgi:chromate transporter
MATLGVVFPSVVIISLLAGVIRVFEDNPIVAKAFTGIRACVCVLILNAVLKLWKSAVKDKLTLGAFLLVLAVALFTDVSPVVLVAAILIFAVVYELTVGRRGGKEAR